MRVEEIQILVADVVLPPPDLTVSEWADQNRRLSSESAPAAPPSTIETIANDAFGCGLRYGALLVGAAETLHGKWTRCSAGLVTTKIGLKSYHGNELQLTRQQLLAEAQPAGAPLAHSVLALGTLHRTTSPLRA